MLLVSLSNVWTSAEPLVDVIHKCLYPHVRAALAYSCNQHIYQSSESSLSIVFSCRETVDHISSRKLKIVQHYVQLEERARTPHNPFRTVTRIRVSSLPCSLTQRRE